MVVVVLDIWYGSKMEEGGIETQWWPCMYCCSWHWYCNIVHTLNCECVPLQRRYYIFLRNFVLIGNTSDQHTTTGMIRSDHVSALGWISGLWVSPYTSTLLFLMKTPIPVQLSSHVWIMTDYDRVCFIVKPTCLWVRNISLQLMNYFSDWWIAGSPHSRVK